MWSDRTRPRLRPSSASGDECGEWGLRWWVSLRISGASYRCRLPRRGTPGCNARVLSRPAGARRAGRDLHAARAHERQLEVVVQDCPRQGRAALHDNSRPEAHGCVIGRAVRRNVKTIQRMLGHTAAAMTLDVYSDLFEDDLDAGVDRAQRRSNECRHTVSPALTAGPNSGVQRGWTATQLRRRAARPASAPSWRDAS